MGGTSRLLITHVWMCRDEIRPLLIAGCEIQSKLSWANLLGSYEKEPLRSPTSGRVIESGSQLLKSITRLLRQTYPWETKDTLVTLTQGTPWLTILSSETSWWWWGTPLDPTVFWMLSPSLLHPGEGMTHGVMPLPTSQLLSYFLSHKPLLNKILAVLIPARHLFLAGPRLTKPHFPCLWNREQSFMPSLHSIIKIKWENVWGMLKTILASAADHINGSCFIERHVSWTTAQKLLETCVPSMYKSRDCERKAHSPTYLMGSDILKSQIFIWHISSILGSWFFFFQDDIELSKKG